jgi:drug/metabolite transporter (DMT)-like permease
VVLVPIFFVLLWSTGFVGAKYGLPYADPFIFLAIRVLIASALLYLYLILKKAQFRLSKEERNLSAVIGLTLHFMYQGGVFFAISQGMPAGIAATVTSLQPILVSLIGIRVLHERLSRNQIAGLIFGFVGVFLVLSPAFNSTSEINYKGIIAIVIALAGSTIATLIQKRGGSNVPLVAGTAFQYLNAATCFLVAAIATRGFRIEWNTKFIFALSWLIFGLSVGAILILLTLLKHGSASQVSSLLYLVPPATAIEAYFLFGEKLTLTEFAGIFLTAIGVFMVIHKRVVNR